jgi:spermidine/putrescine transport system permease protein
MKQRLAAIRTMQLAPTWIALGLFFAMPILLMLAVSFGQRGAHGGIAAVPHVAEYIRSGHLLDNYRKVADPLYARVLWRSVWMALVTTALCLVVSYPVAYYIALVARASWKNTLLALVAVPFWTSFLIRTYAWVLILRSEGLLNAVLLKLHVIGAPLNLLPSNTAILLGLVYGELPFMILPLYASLEKLDRTLLEAAADLGAAPRSAFWRVTVRLTMPGIVAGSVIVFIPSIGQFVVTDVLGGGRIELIGNVIYDQFLTSANDPPLGAALALALSGIVLVMLLGYAIYARGRGEGLEL